MPLAQAHHNGAARKRLHSVECAVRKVQDPRLCGGRPCRQPAAARRRGSSGNTRGIRDCRLKRRRLETGRANEEAAQLVRAAKKDAHTRARVSRCVQPPQKPRRQRLAGGRPATGIVSSGRVSSAQAHCNAPSMVHQRQSRRRCWAGSSAGRIVVEKQLVHFDICCLLGFLSVAAGESCAGASHGAPLHKIWHAHPPETAPQAGPASQSPAKRPGMHAAACHTNPQQQTH